jgi:ABC-type branched-subunit amino acid transport system ATPase component
MIRHPGSAEALAAVQVSKSFGGLLALDQVSLQVRPGEVHGLIGPNGSGKTTLLNMLCGFYQPTGGSVRLGDAPLERASVQARAEQGIARTFQKPRLLPTLSVLDNVMLGAWVHARPGLLSTALAWPRVGRAEKKARLQAMELVHGMGLGHAIGRRADALEHAEQRFLEIARALMMSPRFVLLDEPAGGLSADEIDHLGAVIKTIRDAGIGVLLVEHHTDFVFRICDRVTALDLGRTIRQGSPEEVRNDEAVIRVYLGA